MKKIAELKGIIAGGEFDEKLAQIYLDKDMIPYNRERYVKALDKFTLITSFGISSDTSSITPSSLGATIAMASRLIDVASTCPF